MSWVTKTMVLRSSLCSRRISSCSSSRTTGSTAQNGSSISRTGGSAASARATPDALLLATGELGRVAVAELGSSPTRSSSSRARSALALLSQPSSRGTVAMLSSTVRCGNSPAFWMT